MNDNTDFTIAVMAGDGVGKEIMPPCLDLLDKVTKKIGGISLSLNEAPAGAAVYLDHGNAYPETSREIAQKADAILLGAMGLPDVRYENGTEITPQLDLRFDLELYAGVRPVRAIPGVPLPLSDPRAQTMDFVLIRESTEGLFASHGKGQVVDDRVATDTLVITRGVCEKLFDFSFKLAQQRKNAGSKGELICVDKANIFASYAFFRKVFDEQAVLFSDISTRRAYVDAMAMNMLRCPWEYDVMVMENMFGDILSDLGAGLMGGLGFAPSADIGDTHGVFQPCHGSAPDIAGQGIVNPTAMILSAAMMLEWLGEKHEVDAAVQGAELLRQAVDRAFADGTLITTELGGTARMNDVFDAVSAQI
jgi:3-isopropylmalate dehydrogenase